MPQLGKCARATPPPGCGVGCSRVRRSRLGVWSHGKVHSAQPVGFRMRFSVTTRPQNAPFREGASVECAFPQNAPFLTWANVAPPHGKAHSGPTTSRKSALCSRRNHNSVHKCPKTAPRGRFRRSVYTLCPHDRSCDRVGPRVPQRQRPYGPRDAKVLGPEAHNCRGGGTFALPGAPLAARCPRMSQARHARDAKQGQFGWASRLVRFNAWGL